ncbi:MAG: endo-1,4-beta-xylanase [Balneolaceae bacterium]
MRNLIYVFILAAFAAGCNQSQNNDSTSLKGAFEDSFYIGAALNSSQFGGESDDASIVNEHFNSITAENVMKWEIIHPEPDSFYFEEADKFVAFGEENDMFVIGHTLVWHSQTPQWVFEDEDGNQLSRDALLERMRDHIFAVTERYKGKVHGWDVVNEALNEDGSMRESPWYNIIGEDFVAKAFEFANEADPDAELYYNDYSLNNPAKRDGAVRLVKSIQEQGIRVTGIGMQGHYGLDYPTNEELEASITAFGELGIVAITELDMDVLPSASGYQGADVSATAEMDERLNPYADGLPDSVVQQQTTQFENFFRIFLKHDDVINRVTFWGVTDQASWKNNWPIPGRTNYPLIFDRDGNPKPAADAIRKLTDTE